MKLKINKSTIEAWRQGLERAGRREIGGVLFGEQLAEGDFRIIEATRQRFGGGGPERFQRRGFQARSNLKSLYKQYGGDPSRFNYLGEWHSHPSASCHPSARDELTMDQLLADQAGAVNFLVLIIVRLEASEVLEINAITYLTSGHQVNCEIEIETRATAHDD